MKVITISNHAYYSAVLGCILSIVFLVTGIATRTPLAAIFGAGFLVPCLYSFKKYRSYQLELSEGLITEKTNQKQVTVQFADIVHLDCEVNTDFGGLSLYPVFVLESDASERVTFRTQDQASLCAIAHWVRSNYPSTIVSDNVSKYISNPHARWVFGGNKN